MSQGRARAPASGCAVMESRKASLPPHVFLRIPEPPHFWTLLLCRMTFRSVPSQMLKLLHDISAAAPTQPILPPPPITHTHSHRVSVHEWQIMVLLVLSLCQQEVNCLKDGKLNKARSVDIYPIVLLVLAPKRLDQPLFWWLKQKRKNSEVLIGHVFSHEKKAYLQWKREREKC